MNEATWHWNAALFKTIHATVASPEWLVHAARWLAELPLAVAALLTLWLVWRQDDARIAVRVVLACILVAGVEALVRVVADQPRPFEAGAGTAWVAHAPNNAMPSTHVGLAWAAACVALIGGSLRTGVALVALGVAMGWARIYVGLQWPADIGASAISAVLAAGASLGVERVAGGLMRVMSGRSLRV